MKFAAPALITCLTLAAPTPSAWAQTRAEPSPAGTPATLPQPSAAPAGEPPQAEQAPQAALDAQTEAAAMRWQWSTSAGADHYREPSLDMELQGPELGLHLRLDRFASFPRWTLEADVLAGVHRYDSRASGVMHNSENMETRWRLLYQAWPREGGGLYLGPAIHTFYNDLRGSASRNSTGYERASVGLWLAAQWRQPLEAAGPLTGLQLDAGRLIRARHTSFLSQANRNFLDVENTQRQGWYGQAKLSFKARELLLEPYVRFTHIKDSDLVLARAAPPQVFGYEPASDRWQLGLQVSWPPR